MHRHPIDRELEAEANCQQDSDRAFNLFNRWHQYREFIIAASTGAAAAKAPESV